MKAVITFWTSNENRIPFGSNSKNLYCGTTLVSVKDRKSTRLNSSHLVISYAVFCLKTTTEHAPESPNAITLPLIDVAVGAILFSVGLTPAWPGLESSLTGPPARFYPPHIPHAVINI